MQDKIIHLLKKDFAGWCIPIGYTTEQYYNVEVEERPSAFPFAYRKNVSLLRLPILRKNMISRIDSMRITGRELVHGVYFKKASLLRL